MLLKNLDFKNSLVNGSRGIVVGFTTDAEHVGICDPNSDVLYPVVRFSSGVDHIITHDTWRIELAGQIRASRYQIPLTLAYALSIHKSQGMSIEKVNLSLSKVFTYGQAYVALSRVTSLEGLCLSDFSPSVVRAHPKVILFYNSFKETSYEYVSTEEKQKQQQVDDDAFWSDEDIEQNDSKIEKKEEKSTPPCFLNPSTSSYRNNSNFRKFNSTIRSFSNSTIISKPQIACGQLSPKQLPLSAKAAPRHVDIDLT